VTGATTGRGGSGGRGSETGGGGGVPAPIAATDIAAARTIHRLNLITASPSFSRYSDVPDF
jgi:hypothetical protein